MKKIVAIVTSLVMVIGGLQFSPMVAEEVKAAQFTGSHFAMEFSNYDSANMEKAHGWSNGGMFNCTWQDSNVNFSSDGIMSLTINSNGSGGYTGGEYRSRQTFGYGMYQVNMKPIKNPGVVTSFFTYTGPTDGTIWDEIDIEFLGYDTTKVQFNYFSNSVGNHEYVYNLGFDASTSFHTYGFYWGPGTITWYVDGNAVYTVNSSDVPVTPGKIMMNVWPGTGVDSWLQPYNGVTPLTGYYDWAVYDAPGSGETPTTTQTVKPTTQAPTTTTTTPSSSTTGPDEVFGHLISATTPGIIDVVWGMDSKGQTYNVYVDGSLATSTTGAKLNNVGCAAYQIPASAGTHTVRITSVLNGQESAGVSQTVTVTGSSVVVTTTQPPNNNGYTTAGANWTDLPYWSVYFASGWAGDPKGSYKDGGSLGNFAVNINTASNAEWGVQLRSATCTAEAGKKYKATVTATSNMASSTQIRFKEENTQTEKLYTLVAGTNTFEVEFTSTGSALFFFDLGLAPAGLDLQITDFSLVSAETPTEAPTEAPTEPPTEAPTETPTEAPTESKNIIEGGIEINGYQISAISKGMRTVYSVDSTIDGKEVISSGMVYSLADYATESELYIGSASEYVASFESTEEGKAATCFSDSDIATSYAMTMRFATSEPSEFNAKWRICAYAQLEDGTYVYSKAYVYSIYEVAKILYDGSMMNTKAKHDYLYTDILTKVDSGYEEKEYNWSNTTVPTV